MTTSRNIEAFLTVENEHRVEGRKIKLDVYITKDLLTQVKDGQLEGKLTWKRKDGKFDYAKRVFLEVGRSHPGSNTSPINTTPFPHGQPVEKTVAYKVSIDDSSYVLLYDCGELTGKTQKGSITTTIYIDRRRQAR